MPKAADIVHSLFGRPYLTLTIKIKVLKVLMVITGCMTQWSNVIKSVAETVLFCPVLLYLYNFAQLSDDVPQEVRGYESINCISSDCT